MKRRVVVAVVAALVAFAVAGVVIVRRDGGGHTPARLPIAASGKNAHAGSADAALAPYGVIVYHPGPQLPALAGSTHAYRVTGDDPHAAARRLADALGLHGEPADNGDGGLVLNEGDAQLAVFGASWSFYRSSSGNAVSSSGVAVACPPDAPKCVPEDSIPPPPTRPTGLPSLDDAKAAAIALLDRLGVDTKSAKVDVQDGITQWFVSIDPMVDGIATEGFGYSVVVGVDGVIDSASGVLGTAIAGDEYPLIGTQPAIDRLNAGEGFVGPRPLEAQGSGAAASDVATADEIPPATGAPGSAGSAEPAEPPALPIPDEPPPSSEPPATDTIPPPPPQQDITLTGAERILLLVTSFDGNENWLVPAYRFSTTEGPGPTVIAVDDRFLAPPDGVAPDGAR